ncbi:hypothetical protein ACFVH6_38110 [Spirillospora sp. NPDC127200]
MGGGRAGVGACAWAWACTRAHPADLTLLAKTGQAPASLRAAQSAPVTDLATLGEGDNKVTLGWRGGLPKPQLQGSRATYRNAVPGADVIVEATRTGFEQFVRLNSRPADLTTYGYSYTLPVKTPGLKAKQQSGGSVLFTDAATGAQRFIIPAPKMWDAKTDPVTEAPANVADVAMRVVDKGDGDIDLVLTPDAKWLSAPERKYPVTIDPTTGTLRNHGDVYVREGQASDWKTIDLWFGRSPGGLNRSYITWETDKIADSLIVDAKLSLFNFTAANDDCKPKQWTVWDTGIPDGTISWANHNTKAPWNEQYASSTETHGHDACGGNDLKAGPSWRAEGGIWQVYTPEAVLRDTFTDRDGDKVRGSFQVYDTVTNQPVKAPDNADGVFLSAFVDPGKPAEVKIPAGILQDGKTYKFRTSTYDGTHYSTTWSAWQQFVVTVPEPLPAGLPAGLQQLLTDYQNGALGHDTFAEYGYEKLGVDVKAVDLPAKYRDTAPLSEHQLSLLTGALTAALAKLPQEKVQALQKAATTPPEGTTTTPRRATKDPGAGCGTIARWHIKAFRCGLTGSHFKIYYNIDGGRPVDDLTDANGNRLPDKIEQFDVKLGGECTRATLVITNVNPRSIGIVAWLTVFKVNR